ncbi:MAG: cryptochrome/photolyase family protein [Pseudomonadota bacterium]|nr:cryptochrome/photolyase family protein [Pseudomonadota bacterium]
MKNDCLLVILGDQLFPISELKRAHCNNILMVEDLELCTYEKHHKLKILMVLAAMREKKDELERSGFSVTYIDIRHRQFSEPFESKLNQHLDQNDISSIKMFEVQDKEFEKRLKRFAEKRKIPLLFLPSPFFLLKRYECLDLMNSSKNLRMGNFYKEVRKKFDILLEENQKPTGGNWSFDAENRSKLPKSIAIPPLFNTKKSVHVTDLKTEVEQRFLYHPGNTENLWMPITRSDALDSLDYFLSHKLSQFGTYEDAISRTENFIFHSALSPSLNIGLITPHDVVQRTLKYADKFSVPINSLEGFLRQIIGWREFIRGVYLRFSEVQLVSNYFNHSKTLSKTWYSGETGIPPLDDAIKFSIKYGYTHHINRLMLLSNIMTLSEINPLCSYRWFMEMYVDAAEWVMTPNVFGMGTFADGGIFSTKPYICSSRYVLKMSNYEKGDWCDTLDGLYWRFVHKNLEKLATNPRMPFLKSTLSKLGEKRKTFLFQKAEDFIERNCI